MAKVLQDLIGEQLIWTKHSKSKMRHYNLSENRLKRVFRNPDRKEIGITPKTIAIMQRTGTKKHPTEIWLMYQKEKIPPQRGEARPTKLGGETIKIISAWRYPGRSPRGQPPPIPEDILFELNEARNSN